MRHLQIYILFTLTLIFSELFFTNSSLMAADRKKKIVMSISRSKEDVFYSMLVKYAKAAAKSLNMELEVFYGRDNHIKITENYLDIIKRDDVDGIIFENFKNTGIKILNLIEENKIPSVNIIYGFENPHLSGKPREKFKHWIAQVLPDERNAGRQIADLLISQALPSKDGKIHMIGIGGEQSTSASKLRIKGLLDSVKNHKNVVLHQVTNAPGWKYEHAKRKFKVLKSTRFPKTTIAWMASDLMALGAIEGAKEMGLTPGKDVIFAGVDWIVEGYDAIDRGELLGSVGGQLLTAAWSIVLLHDYLNGDNFSDTNYDFILPYELITKENIDSHLKWFNLNVIDQLDFSKFSRVFYPNQKNYHFSVRSLKEQIQMKYEKR